MMRIGFVGPVGIWLLVMVGSSLSVKADHMVLDNGEEVEGTLLEMTQGQVIFASEYLAQVIVPCEHVESLVTAEPVVLRLANGEVLEKALVDSSPLHQLAVEQAGHVRILALEEIMAIDSLGDLGDSVGPKPAPDSNQGKADSPWTGAVNGGLTSVHGQTRTRSYSGSFKLDRRLEKIKTALSSDYGRASQEDADTGRRRLSEDWWKAYGKLSYYFTKKNYSFIDGRYEIDSVANLKHRVALGAGAGYQFVESEDVKISVDLGGASLLEEYEPESDQDSSELSLQMGYDMDLKINDNLKLIHDITYYPNGRKFSDYYLTSTTEIRQQLTKTLFANMKGIFNYDAFPASGTMSTDIKYIFGVGVSF